MQPRTIITFFNHPPVSQLSALLVKLACGGRFCGENCKIIDVCMKSHNFIVEHRNNESFSNSDERVMMIVDVFLLLIHSWMILE